MGLNGATVILLYSELLAMGLASNLLCNIAIVSHLQRILMDDCNSAIASHWQWVLMGRL